MQRDFTKRPNRMRFRFEPDSTYGTGSNSGPQQAIGTVPFPFAGTGEKTDTFKLPLPSRVVGGGSSRSITAADGAGGAWDGWRDPASPVCKPGGKGYTK